LHITQHQPSSHLNMQKPTHRPKKKIPKYGKPAPCKPIGFPHASKDEEVKWAWIPEWSNLAILLIVVSLLFALGFILLLLGAARSNGGIIAVGVILFIATGPFLCILPNWMWNARKQEAHSHARFKSIEAESLWTTVGPQFRYQAKDLYFETGYGGKRLKVLRDGTIEVHGSHNDIGEGGGEGDVGGDCDGDGGDFDAGDYGAGEGPPADP